MVLSLLSCCIPASSVSAGAWYKNNAFHLSMYIASDATDIELCLLPDWAGQKTSVQFDNSKLSPARGERPPRQVVAAPECQALQDALTPKEAVQYKENITTSTRADVHGHTLHFGRSGFVEHVNLGLGKNVNHFFCFISHINCPPCQLRMPAQYTCWHPSKKYTFLHQPKGNQPRSRLPRRCWY